MDSITIPTSNFIGLDNLSNQIYVDGNVLYKKNAQQVVQFQNITLGKITKVDILNPLRILLYYADFNTVIIVDNQLNEIQKIDFSNHQKPLFIGAIGTASQNKIWVYNSLDQQLGLYDLANQTFKNIGVQLQQEFRYYQTDFNFFVWIDSDYNLYSSSIFGKIDLLATVKPFDRIQVINSKQILYSKDGIVFLDDIITKKNYQIEIVEKSFEKLFYDGHILTIFTKKDIINYKIIIP